MKTRKIRPMVALMVGALFLAACGGSDNGADNGGGDGGSTAGATAFSVDAKEFAFDPDLWRVAADQDVTISLNNAGSIEHDWTILSAGTSIGGEAELSEDAVLFDLGSVDAGVTGTGTFNVPAGTYQVICSIPGHFDAGMEGELSAS